MALLADYHTHTKYSRNHHGKGTIEENVRVAYEKGLRQIAITDHGFNQKLYGVRRKDIPKVRADIEDAKERYPIDVLLGVEANLISSQGDIDIVPEDMKNLDILLCGFHRLVKSTSTREQFGFVLKKQTSTLSPFKIDKKTKKTGIDLRTDISADDKDALYLLYKVYCDKRNVYTHSTVDPSLMRIIENYKEAEELRTEILETIEKTYISIFKV